MKKKQYRRLPGRARKYYGLLSRQQMQLWLADDHLLCLMRTAYTESYKRFYLKDIQAITWCRNTVSRTTNQMLTFTLLMCVFISGLGFAGHATGSKVLAIVFSIIGGLLAVFLLLNLVFGPTCTCILFTAATTEELTCLGRLRTARKVAPMLQQQIEAVQGRLAVSPDAAETPEMAVD